MFTNPVSFLLARRRPGQHLRRPRCERLEDRCLPSYTAVDLGGCTPTAVNALGDVTTYASAYVGTIYHVHGSVRHDGIATDLGNLGGATCYPYRINSAGQVVGVSDNAAGQSRAFLVTPLDTDGDGRPDCWFRDANQDGVNDLMIDLGTLGGQTSAATGINADGRVVGSATTATNWRRAFLWDATVGMQDLGTFGGNLASAAAINATGLVAGTAQTSFGQPHANGINDSHGYLADTAAGTSVRLAPLGGDTATAATDVNDAGQAVGTSGVIAYSVGGMAVYYYYQARHAVLWQNGQATSLGTLPGSVTSSATGINSAGQAVGASGGAAFVWQAGVMTDLNMLINPILGWHLSGAADVSDTGLIVGTGTFNGAFHGFLLAPADPRVPASFAVAGFASPATAGAAGSFAVTALNGDGSVAAGYTGTVHFTSSDPQAVLPADYTFNAADGGTHSFATTLKTAGVQSITAIDTSAGLAGVDVGIQVNSAAANRFVISGPSSARAGTAFSITVTAYDLYGNVATDYRGTVHFKSSDTGATLSADYTFTMADAGIHIFTGLKLRRKGMQTITLTDTFFPTITGTWSTSVL
jgi:probable HAF family extracellular repeat protein